MPRRRARRGESNEEWETSGMEEGYVDGPSSIRNINRVSPDGVGERGDDIDNNHANNVTSGGRSHQIGEGSSPQHRKKPDLDQWSQLVNDTVQSMEVADRAIKVLRNKFKSHIDDIKNIEKTRDRLSQLEEMCSDKDEEIKRQGYTITTLTDMSRSSNQEIEHQRKVIEKEKKELDQEKLKQEKRVTTATAEERTKLQGEFDRLVADQGKSYDKRKKELEDDFAKQQDDSSKRLATIEAEMKQLSLTVHEQKKTIEMQKKELEKTTEQCDLLERAKDSLKREKRAQERELQTMRNELALNFISKDEFKRRFAAMQSRIEEVSSKFFSDVHDEDQDQVHDELAKKDLCFKSVPIDDSDDSRDLRMAHAQRIVCDAICEYIWKPLRSEFTLLHPEFDKLLGEMLGELEKSSPGGRAVNVWTALSMRALQSLPARSLPSNALELEKSHRSTGSRRIQSVVSKVLSTLSPLISSSQSDELRVDLQKLANEAIDIWNNAQASELKIVVIPSLDRANIEEWRSQESDPTSPSGIIDIKSETHNRIFTLFPRVIAREVADQVEHSTGPPGGWPPEPNQASRTIETCIHPGKGLPEWSSLVVRGKKAQEEKDDYISKALETARKEMHSTRRVSGHGRRESTGSSTSVLSTASQRWNMENVMKHTEN